MRVYAGGDNLLRCLILTLPLLFAAERGFAFEKNPCTDVLSPFEREDTVMSADLRIEAVAPRELTSRDGDFALSRTSIASRTTPPIVIRRAIPELWWRLVPVDVDPGRIRVDYRLLIDGKETNELRHVGTGERGLAMNLRPIAPVVRCRRGDKNIVVGGVVLELNPHTLRHAGKYNVDVEVTVELP